MGAQVPIARRNLLADRVKTLLALGGVASAVLLILVVQSLYQGVNRDFASFVRGLPGDVWVGQVGGDLVYSNSFLTDQHAADVQSIAGVDAVHRLYGRITSFEAGGDEVQIYVWALAPGSALTAEESRPLPRPGTIIIDRSLAGEAGVSVGDVLSNDGRDFAVADVGRVGNVLLVQFAFISAEDYFSLFGSGGGANFFLVSLGPDANDSTMDEITRRVGHSSIYTTDEFVSVAQEPVREFLPLIRVLVALSSIVGLALLSSTIYSATIERSREFGVMKVLGASPLQLYQIVVSQAAIITFLGFGAGVGLAFLFNSVAGDLVPQFRTYIRWQDVALVMLITAFMALIASFIPIYRIARVDAASVFKA